ncbi:MAG: zinc ABC transporter substrate-binding protein [Spirochaetota bacterium]|nr:zinc ABC transporter substrate-binding protein [Spirochaetota bacterium]
MQRNQLIIIILTIFTVLFTSCNRDSTAQEDLIHVFVSIEPQKFFIEKIGGKWVVAEVMVKPGQSPATYEPTPSQITKLGKSDQFFSIGVPFEKAFLEKIRKSLPNLIITDTSDGIKKREISGHDHDADHEEYDESDLKVQEQMDPHIWMSPLLVKKQASNMLRALISLKPEYRDYFTENYNKFASDLDAVHMDIKKSLEGLEGSTIFVYHPSFGYFTDLYGFEQIAIETGGKEPGPKELENIINEVIEDEVKVIFVQPEFQSSSIKVITEATGAAVISVNPLNYDYLDNLRYMADILGDSLQ